MKILLQIEDEEQVFKVEEKILKENLENNSLSLGTSLKVIIQEMGNKIIQNILSSLQKNFETELDK